jgi:HSP20 family protein
MYRTLFPSNNDLLSHFDRLQQEMQQYFGGMDSPTSIRAVAQGSFPPINVVATPQAVEVYAFAPGLDPAKLDINVDRGVLSLAGERLADAGTGGHEGVKGAAVYTEERFAGKFKRTIALTEDLDGTQAEAQYKDGVLRITLPRTQASQPKRIEVR